MGHASLTSARLPRRARPTAAAASQQRRAATWALPARLDRQPAVRDRGRGRRRARRARPAGDRPRDRSAPSSSPTARTSRGTPSSTPARIRARIFERGVGETLSSGTGATGAAVAYVEPAAGGRAAGAGSTVVLDGGELEVEVDADLHVHLTGWARPVFAGTSSATSSKRSCMRPSKRLEQHPAVRVRRAGAQDRREARGGHRRDQPRHRRPGPPDAAADRRGDAGGRDRARDAPVPLQPRPRRLPRGRARLLRAPLRRRRSTPTPRSSPRSAPRRRSSTSTSRSSTRATTRSPPTPATPSTPAGRGSPAPSRC